MRSLFTVVMVVSATLVAGGLAALAQPGPSGKLCSAVHPAANVGDFAWRDTVNALDEWSIRDCSRFARSIGATHFQIGCMSDRGVRWGPMIGTDKRAAEAMTRRSRECGWQVRDEDERRLRR